MHTFSVEVIFTVGEKEVSEDKILDYFTNKPENLDDYYEMEGALLFAIGSNRIRLEDQLSYLFPTLVLEMLPTLLKNQESELILYSSPANFHFKSDGEIVTMSGNYLPDSFQFPQSEMVTQLVDACYRFLNIVEKVWPNHSKTYDSLRKKLEKIMSKEKQAQLITDIGEMIIDDYIAQNIAWEALSFVVTLYNGTRSMTGYRYLKDESFEASTPEDAGDVIRKCRVLKEEMSNNGEGTFVQCLIHITKPDYNIRLQFEFDNPERWKPKIIGMDMSTFVNALRPE